jgi:hypothetical protein
MAFSRNGHVPPAPVTAGKLAGILAIYLGASAAWMILGASVSERTADRSVRTGDAVQSLWGSEQQQSPPRAWSVWTEKTVTTVPQGTKSVREIRVTNRREPLPLVRSDLAVGLDWEPRRKGLLWHRTYRIAFAGVYTFRDDRRGPHQVEVQYDFPTSQAIYDDFRLRVAGRESQQPLSTEHGLQERVTVRGAGDVPVRIGFRSQGIDRWSYHFGNDVSRIRDFRLAMTTDFKAIDFPERTLSPSRKQPTARGWDLLWEYRSLVSGLRIGMEMPQPLNPGPLAARMSWFAPVSLLFFFFILFIITVLRDLRLHPIHYLFLAGAFFSFHLLFAYLADHLLPLPAFLICAAVSVGLVVSYLRLVTGTRFAVVEAGLSQLVYLVLFSYAFFFEGLTGLAITLVSILSLFVVMQLTGRINWDEKFSPRRMKEAAEPEPPASPAAPAGTG